MGFFNNISRWNKVWILATVFSLMLYDLYWIRGVYSRIYTLLFEASSSTAFSFYLDHVAGGIANTLRLIAVFLLFFAVYLTWGPKKQPFTSVKKYLAISILFEAIYWLSILPYNLWSIANGRSPLLLYAGFAIQTVIAGVTLIVLSIKVWKYTFRVRENLIKWGCIAGIGYIFGMWINITLRWLIMSGQGGLADLFTGFTALGFLNTIITLTLSLVFAFAGYFLVARRANLELAVKLLGLAILLFGLHFGLYVVYAWFAPNAWIFVLLTEIWPLPLIGLGIGMLKGRA